MAFVAPLPGSAKPPAGPPRRQAMLHGPSHQLGAARDRRDKLPARLACVLVLVSVRAETLLISVFERIQRAGRWKQSDQAGHYNGGHEQTDS
jgi:hypothetical protein